MKVGTHRDNLSIAHGHDNLSIAQLIS